MPLRLHDPDPTRGFMKRCIDVVVALAAVVILFPVILLVGLAVFLASGRPVLFRQLRPGLRGRPFAMLKFRTMRNGPEPDAERLTRLGRMLRASSLDELPELWNIMKGDMSIVGPRPLLMDYLPLYTAKQARRHEVRPGLTGLAQVSGRNAISWRRKFALDVWYVDHHSLGLDLKIMALTAFKILRRSDIHAAGEATMPRFTGMARP
jgi:lipopolysaccharide/colanic/teichoic acid biosynthesis glycosyltransferase